MHVAGGIRDIYYRGNGANYLMSCTDLHLHLPSMEKVYQSVFVRSAMLQLEVPKATYNKATKLQACKFSTIFGYGRIMTDLVSFF